MSWDWLFWLRSHSLDWSVVFWLNDHTNVPQDCRILLVVRKCLLVFGCFGFLKSWSCFYGLRKKNCFTWTIVKTYFSERSQKIKHHCKTTNYILLSQKLYPKHHCKIIQVFKKCKNNQKKQQPNLLSVTTLTPLPPQLPGLSWSAAPERAPLPRTWSDPRCIPWSSAGFWEWLGWCTWGGRHRCCFLGFESWDELRWVESLCCCCFLWSIKSKVALLPSFCQQKHAEAKHPWESRAVRKKSVFCQTTVCKSDPFRLLSVYFPLKSDRLQHHLAYLNGISLRQVLHWTPPNLGPSSMVCSWKQGLIHQTNDQLTVALMAKITATKLTIRFKTSLKYHHNKFLA